MNKPSLLAAALALAALLLAGCAAQPTPTPGAWGNTAYPVSSGPTETPVVYPPPADSTATPAAYPLPAEASTPTATAGHEAFEAALGQALAARDWAQLQAMMGKTFIIGFWRSEGQLLAPAEAVEQLQVNWLTSQTSPAVEKPDAAELSELVGEVDPYYIWGLEVKVVSVLLSPQGWGEDGKGQALLIVAQRPDGSYYWHAVLVAPGGF